MVNKVNSFTSNSKTRCPDINTCREFFISLLVFLGLGSILVGINTYVDPFDFQISPIRLDVDRRTVFRRKNTALWAAGEIQRIPRDVIRSTNVVVIGDSRGRQLTGPKQRVKVLEDLSQTVANVSFGGAHQGEMIHMFKGFESNFETVDTAIIVVSFDRLSQSSDIERIDNAVRSAKFPLYYLLNFRTVSSYWEEIVVNAYSNYEQKGSKKAPDYGTGLATLVSNKKGGSKKIASVTDEKIIDIVGRRIQATEEAVAIGLLEKEVFPFVDHLRAKGVKVIFYIPPVHPKIEAVIYKFKMSSYNRVIEKLLQKGHVYDLSLYDGPQSIFEFADPMHVSGVAHFMLQDILQCFNIDERKCQSRFDNSHHSPFLFGESNQE